MQGLLPVAAVFIGGGLGSMARYLVGLAAARWIGSGFPAGTLIVNATGSLLMGLLAGLIAIHPRSDHNLALFLTTGMMGGFTTYSTFSLDTATLGTVARWGWRHSTSRRPLSSAWSASSAGSCCRALPDAQDENSLISG